MIEFVAGVLGVILLSEIMLMIMPDGSIKRYVRLAAGVLAATMMIAPIRSCGINGGTVIEQSGEQQVCSDERTYSDIIMDVYNQAMENKN